MANDGTIIGSPTFVPGASGFGQAIVLDGSSEYVSLPAGVFNPPTGSGWTITARVKTTSSALAIAVGIHATIFMGAQGTGGYFYVASESGGGEAIVINDGQWHELSMDCDGTTSTVCRVDGVTALTLPGAYTQTANDTSEIGAYNGTYLWSGQIQDVAFYSTRQHSADYTPATGIASDATPNLIAMYHLNGDATNTAGAVAPVQIAVNDTNVFFSPYNWFLSGTAYAQCNNAGGYMKLGFTGSTLKLKVDTTPNQAGPETSTNYPTILYRIDDSVWTRYQVSSGDTSIVIAGGLAAGNHQAEIRIIAMWLQDDRWNTPVSVLRVTGFTLSGGAATVAPVLFAGRALLYADSNGEGYEVLALGLALQNADASQAAAAIIGPALNCEIGIVAYASQGYDYPGQGNVPTLQSAWNLYFSGQSRLVGGAFTPAPDWIISITGENDTNIPDSVVSGVVGSLAAAWRAAAPNAKIVFGSPADLTKLSAIQAGVPTNDPKTKFASTGINYLSTRPASGTYNNNAHLTVRGHALYASAMIDEIVSAFAVASNYTPAIGSFAAIAIDQNTGGVGNLLAPFGADTVIAVNGYGVQDGALIDANRRFVQPLRVLPGTYSIIFRNGATVLSARPITVAA